MEPQIGRQRHTSPHPDAWPHDGPQTRRSLVVIDGLDDLNCVTCGKLSNAYSYDLSSVSSLSNTNGPQRNGALVTVDGSGFGYALWEGLVYVVVNDKKCVSSFWISDTRIICNIPDSFGTSKDVSVFVSNQTSILRRSFSYDRSVVSRVVKSQHGPQNRLSYVM